MAPRSRHRALPARALAVLIGLVATPLLGGAATAEPSPNPLIGCVLSTDVTVDLDPDPATLAASPSSLIAWSLQAGVALGDDFAVATQPAANLDAFQEVGNGARLLSYDVAVELADLTVAHPADVIFESAPPARGQGIFLDHRLVGIADSADVDAIAVIENTLLLSFASTTVVLAGQPDELTAGPSDLVAFDLESGDIEVVFRAAEFGVPAGVNMDAAEIVDGRLLASFDVGGTVPSAFGPNPYADEDVMVFDPDTGRWFTGLETAAKIAGIEAADVDAITGCRFQKGLSTPTSTPLSTATSTATATATGTATATATVTASLPPNATATATSPPAATATATATPPPGATATSTATASSTPTASSTGTATSGAAACVGDCNASAEVAINELITGVNIALGGAPLATCPSFDPNGDGAVGINELIQAVNNALNGCA